MPRGVCLVGQVADTAPRRAHTCLYARSVARAMCLRIVCFFEVCKER